MLAKKAGVHLSIFLSQGFSWPERKALQLGPDQGVRMALSTQEAERTHDI